MLHVEGKQEVHIGEIGNENDFLDISLLKCIFVLDVICIG